MVTITYLLDVMSYGCIVKLATVYFLRSKILTEPVNQSGVLTYPDFLMKFEKFS